MRLAKQWMIAGTEAVCTSGTAIFSIRAKISRAFLRNAAAVRRCASVRPAAPKAARGPIPRHPSFGSIQPGPELPLLPYQPAGFISAQAPYRAGATAAPILVATDFLTGFPQRACPRAKEIEPTTDFASGHCFTGLVAGEGNDGAALHTADCELLPPCRFGLPIDRKSTRLNSSH